MQRSATGGATRTPGLEGQSQGRCWQSTSQKWGCWQKLEMEETQPLRNDCPEQLPTCACLLCIRPLWNLLQGEPEKCDLQENGWSTNRTMTSVHT